MTSAEPLENLVKVGQLKREPPSKGETEGLLQSGEARLADAAKRSLSLESRFDLAYNAAHALPHTLGLSSATSRVLAKGHDARNVAEYEGAAEIDERLVTDLIDAAQKVLAALRAALEG